MFKLNTIVTITI